MNHTHKYTHTCITGTLPSYCLESYQGHSLGKSYSSAEKQSVYATTPANWTKIWTYN